MSVQTVRYVSLVFDDDVKASGYRFECPDCGWKSPVMKWIQGAERHFDEHVCDD